jgi:hypothetical protein
MEEPIMTLQDVVDRCSRFSGYRLEYRFEESHGDRLLVIEDPSVGPHSSLVVKIHPACDLVLYEVYGRLRHWGVTLDEEEVMRAALQHLSHAIAPAKDV